MKQRLSAWLLAPLIAALAGCMINRPTDKPISIYKTEKFETTSQFARRFPTSASTTCEAARRALLSQGYIAVIQGPLRINARKNFQPQRDAHLTIEFTVVCTSESGLDEGPSTVFTTATQDRYTVKIAPGQSASVGSPLGSLSVPLSVSDDSLVKIASETIPAGEFYDRFYKLVEFYIDPDIKRAAEDGGGRPAESAGLPAINPLRAPQ